MEEYIKKSAVVAEINDWRDKIMKGILSIPLSWREKADATFEYEILGKVISYLDTLEVKEVDSTLQNGWSYNDETMRLAIEYIIHCAPLVGIISENTENLKSWLRDIKKRMSCLE